MPSREDDIPPTGTKNRSGVRHAIRHFLGALQYPFRHVSETTITMDMTTRLNFGRLLSYGWSVLSGT